MKRDLIPKGLNYQVSDSHVHIGQGGLSKLRFSIKDLQEYAKEVDAVLVFPFDMDLDETNKKLVEMLPRLDHVYGLLRFQLVDYLKSFKYFLHLLDHSKILGVKLHPTFDRIPVTHTFFDDVFEALEEREMLCLVHAGRWKDVSHCSFVFERARKHKSLTFIVAHMGGNELPNSKAAIRLAKKCPNTYLETSNCRMSWIIKEAVETIGSKRVLFGSDIPWGSFLPNFTMILESDISEEAKRNILHNNFQELIAR